MANTCDITSLLYVFYNPDTKRTKIGISNNVYRRLCQIRNASGCPVYCVYITNLDNEDLFFNVMAKLPATVKELEDHLHNHFKEYRYIGEWFNIPYSKVTRCLKGRYPNLKNKYISLLPPKWLSFTTWKEFLQYYS